MQALSDGGFAERLKSDNHGPYTAGLILEKIDCALSLIRRNRSLDLELPDNIARFPELSKRIEQFQDYAAAIPKERFASNWCKHVGGMAIPFKRRGGNIHLYLLDDGLLSKSIPSVPELDYETRSRFFLNRVFGLEREFSRIKGKIHLHAISVSDLESPDIMAIKEAVAHEHEASGNYMPRSSMLPFSLRRLCPIGSVVQDCPDLAVNDPRWFAEMIPKWRLE